MKVLVIGGMHGNEPLGPEVVRLFKKSPKALVTAVLANEQAIGADCRFVKNDLNRSFPGDVVSRDYEIKRAAELLAITEGYDTVIDFHNTHCPGNDCGFVGEAATPQLYSVSAWLGLKRIIVADYDCINKYASNCLSIEISLDSQLMDAELWYERIARLAELTNVPDAAGIEKYRFAYRMTLDNRDNLELPNRNLKAFQPIDEKLAKVMNIDSPAYPIFIADKYTPYNYGGLLNRLD